VQLIVIAVVAQSVARAQSPAAQTPSWEVSGFIDDTLQRISTVVRPTSKNSRSAVASRGERRRRDCSGRTGPQK
jgi:hypothetical protein